MKKYFFALLMFPLTALAKDIYSSFVVEGKTWKMMLTDASHVYDREGSCFLKGDTVIGGHKCLKMFSTDSYSDEGATYECAVYQEGDKVYGIRNGQVEPALWYDFGAKVGDELYIGNEEKGVVQKVDTLWFAQVGFKRFYVRFHGGTICWLSGIGNVRDPMKILPMPGRINEVLSCDVDGQPILKNVVYYIKNHESLLDEDKVWTVRSVSSNLEQTVWFHEYEFMGESSDSHIDGFSLKRLYTRSRMESEDEWSEWHDASSVGEDNSGKVYYGDGSFDANALTMDFSLLVGDVIRKDGPRSWVVTAVTDTILGNSVDKTPRRCIYLSRSFNGELLSEDYNRDVWIEGIGSLRYGPVGLEGDKPGASSTLINCTQQGRVIYQYEEATSVPQIRQHHADTGKAYDLQGRRMAGEPERGIYIRDGRKVVR